MLQFWDLLWQIHQSLLKDRILRLLLDLLKHSLLLSHWDQRLQLVPSLDKRIQLDHLLLRDQMLQLVHHLDNLIKLWNLLLRSVQLQENLTKHWNRLSLHRQAQL